MFDDDDKIQQVVAQSESERDSWIQMLHMASYEYMRSQLEGLQGKIASRCGKASPSGTSDVDAIVKRPHANSVSGGKIFRSFLWTGLGIANSFFNSRSERLAFGVRSIRRSQLK